MKRTPAILSMVLFGSLPMQAALAAEGKPAAPVVPVEDYVLYDQVVKNKFLSSHTQLVALERMTVSHLLPGQEGPMTLAFFQKQDYFDGRLPQDLARDFVGANQGASRLEGRFQFGLRYRFVSGQGMEEPEVSLGFRVSVEQSTVMQNQAIVDRLAFSRVGRTLRNDQALLYVENPRPDGTGAGFLVWFRKQAHNWTIVDTEVVWAVHDGEGGVESP